MIEFCLSIVYDISQLTFSLEFKTSFLQFVKLFTFIYLGNHVFLSTQNLLSGEQLQSIELNVNVKYLLESLVYSTFKILFQFLSGVNSSINQLSKLLAF